MHKLKIEYMFHHHKFYYLQQQQILNSLIHSFEKSAGKYLLVVVAAGWGAAAARSVASAIPRIVTSEGRWFPVCRLSVVVSGWWGPSVWVSVI